MPIELSKEAKQAAQASIQRYFEKELDHPIGGLEAESLLLFFLKEIAPSVYNKAVSDVQERVSKEIMEIDAYIYEDEFAYWQDKKRKK